jgi:hypothetical protein
VAALAAFPVLVVLREVADQNRYIRRMWRKASTTLRFRHGEAVVVRATVRPLGHTLRAPYSRRECLGYWAQFTGTHFGTEGSVREDRYVAEDHVQLAPLVAEVGDAKLLVERARLICDPRSGEGARLRGDEHHAAEVDVFVPMTKELLRRARHQEHLLRAGDEVVLVAQLEAVGSDPYRDAVGATHRVLPGATLILRPADLAAGSSAPAAPPPAERPRVDAIPYRRSR